MTSHLTCRLLGHRWQFGAERDMLVWRCARGCEVGGERRYGSAEEAGRRAALLERSGRPPLGLLSALAGVVHREPRQPGAPERGKSANDKTND